MIKKINITNFKCYKNCKLNLKNINILCGPNSSGKSSINQAFLFLLQNNHGNSKKLITNGKFVHFDEFNEIKNEGVSNDKKVLIEIYNENGKKNTLEIQESKEKNKIECTKNKRNFSFLEEEDIYYLSADRIGPVDVYDKFDQLIGSQGQNAVGYIVKNKDKPIDDKYAYIKDPKKSYVFIKEINYWLNEIVGEEITPEDLNRTERTLATYKKENHSTNIRNKNTGSGISYLISIITMVFSLALKKPVNKPLFIIENPEIHLHPLAQIKLMDFLVFMSNFCQLIIETHSDHIIKYILQNNNIDGQLIKLKDFEPVYFDNSTNNQHILSNVSIGEVKWSVFDLPTIDFHVQLFSCIQNNIKQNINSTDDFIRKTKAFLRDANKYETNFPRWEQPKKTETLPVYMRNLIDHPEPRRNLYRDEKEFDEKLRESINLMIKILEENGWK